MPQDRYPPISDYGAIGDCRTLALVSRQASIDWWCLPRFDAPSLFARLLDDERGGSLHLEAPSLRFVGRRYVGDSAVLETRLETARGALIVTDLLAVHGEPGLGRGPDPYAEQKLVRLIRCERGRVRLTIVARPRPDYAREEPRLAPAGEGDAAHRTLAFRASGRQVRLTATADWQVDGGEARASVELGPDDEVGVVIDYGPGDHGGESSDDGGDEGGRLVRCDLDQLHAWRDATLRFWHDWIGVSDYDGPYRGLVRRSAITLKLLTYHPTGAIVAAGTTSLPEVIGGERNWDYRFTWLRDATFTLYALHTLGYRAESDAFMTWLRRACRERLDPLVLYRVDGSIPSEERLLDHLEGYRGSRPVRVGNAAAWQRQHDIYGEVLDAAYLDLRSGNTITDDEWELLAHVADLAAEHWRKPDSSIWEPRGPARHFTYSKVLCWVALDRARRLARLLGKEEAAADRLRRWADEAQQLRREVLERGRRTDGAFVQAYGSDALDASALLFPLIGFVRGDSDAARATLDGVLDELAHDGLVKRYLNDEEVEGLPGREGAFLICSYWACDNLALLGRLDEARQRFEELSGLANDLGLFSEEWDAGEEQMLGNFPQAFTHIALISSAHNLERAAAGRMQGDVRREAPHDEPR